MVTVGTEYVLGYVAQTEMVCHWCVSSWSLLLWLRICYMADKSCKYFTWFVWSGVVCEASDGRTTRESLRLLPRTVPWRDVIRDVMQCHAGCVTPMWRHSWRLTATGAWRVIHTWRNLWHQHVVTFDVTSFKASCKKRMCTLCDCDVTSFVTFDTS